MRALQGCHTHCTCQVARTGANACIEQRTDLLLSTLRWTVEAIGGSLSLIATFPDRPPVELAGIAERESRD